MQPAVASYRIFKLFLNKHEELVTYAEKEIKLTKKTYFKS